MVSFLLLASIVASFAFPAFLIGAIKYDTEVMGKNTILACISFGILVTGFLLIIVL